MKFPYLHRIFFGSIFLISAGFSQAATQLPCVKAQDNCSEWVALDAHGNLSGSCTTSGQGFKMRGRLGDSPIIGAGLFVDNEIGAATATGQGEDVIRICGSHLVVELMRMGNSPEQACKKAVERIIKIKGDKARDIQVGFIAINKRGEYGGYCIQKGFNFAVCTGDDANILVDGKHIL